MNLRSLLNIKSIYRVTGTPENYLTALRFLIWGFNESRQNDWKSLMPGDIIFFHSKGSDSYFIKSPMSCVIGFGVVGDNFFRDDMPLWIDEKLKPEIKYPYRFYFSEVYFFTDIPVNNDWDSTSLDKFEPTKKIIEKMLSAGLPLSELIGFPKMGSYSSIKNELVKDLLINANRPLSFYGSEIENDKISKSSKLTELNSVGQVSRYSTTLTGFDEIKERIVEYGNTTRANDVEALSKAEKAHCDILTYLLSNLKDRGYKTFSNNHVDLFAYNDKNSLLVEAKSIENRNFIPQARKSIAQLFEYNYFEISKHKNDLGLSFKSEYKMLATSQIPSDKGYVDFVNSLEIKTLAIVNKGIVPYGDSVDFDKI